MDPCALSSLIFLINIILGFYTRSFLYTTLFTLLMSSSIMFHSCKHTSLKYMDMTIVALVTFYGATLFFTKCKKCQTIVQYVLAILIVGCFLSCLYVYQYWAFIMVPIGPIQTYPYHSYIHYLTCFGNTLLILL